MVVFLNRKSFADKHEIWKGGLEWAQPDFKFEWGESDKLSNVILRVENEESENYSDAELEAARCHIQKTLLKIIRDVQEESRE